MPRHYLTLDPGSHDLSLLFSGWTVAQGRVWMGQQLTDGYHHIKQGPSLMLCINSREKRFKEIQGKLYKVVINTEYPEKLY
jgi:hypothetical protein